MAHLPLSPLRDHHLFSPCPEFAEASRGRVILGTLREDPAARFRAPIIYPLRNANAPGLLVVRCFNPRFTGLEVGPLEEDPDTNEKAFVYFTAMVRRSLAPLQLHSIFWGQPLNLTVTVVVPL